MKKICRMIITLLFKNLKPIKELNRLQPHIHFPSQIEE
jgi:hypothetical protein